MSKLNDLEIERLPVYRWLLNVPTRSRNGRAELAPWPLPLPEASAATGADSLWSVDYPLIPSSAPRGLPSVSVPPKPSIATSDDL